MAEAIYGETKLPLVGNETIPQVKELLARFYPEVRNSEGYTDADGNIRFRVSAGTKGAEAIYGETKLPLVGNETIPQVKELLARFYPEVRNSEGYTDADGNIRFRVSAGTKGN